jgi:hypothetical protein
VKDIGAGGAAGANKMHALSQEEWPTFRYAGCEPRDDPYFSENCSSFVAGAPGVVVQAANMHWSTAVWYGGFGALLQQEIVNIGGASNIGALSPAICPALPDGLGRGRRADTGAALRADGLDVRAGHHRRERFHLLRDRARPAGKRCPGRAVLRGVLSYFRTGTKRGVA